MIEPGDKSAVGGREPVLGQTGKGQVSFSRRGVAVRFSQLRMEDTWLVKV
jgi:hypothetical protein